MFQEGEGESCIPRVFLGMRLTRHGLVESAAEGPVCFLGIKECCGGRVFGGVSRAIR